MSSPAATSTPARALLADEYDRLPVCIRATLTRKQWLWCSDAEKRNLIRSRTEPEWMTLD